MPLDTNDLEAIGMLLDQKLGERLKPIEADIAIIKGEIIQINARLTNLEKWIPVENSNVVKPRKAAAA